MIISAKRLFDSLRTAVPGALALVITAALLTASMPCSHAAESDRLETLDVPYVPEGYPVTAVAAEADGSVWFGVYGSGLFRYFDGVWTPYTTDDGLADKYITDMAFTPDGDLWISSGSGGGLSRFDGSRWTVYTEADGLLSNLVHSLAVDGYGRLWCVTEGVGLSRFDGDGWETIERPVYDCAAASGDTLWCAMDRGVALFDGLNFTVSTVSDGLYDNSVTSVAVAPDGSVWAGHEGAVSRFDGEEWESFSSFDGIPDGRVGVIEFTQDGEAWIGTREGAYGDYGGGAARFDGVEWITFTTADGLASDTVYDIAVGTDGTVWFGVPDARVSKYTPLPLSVVFDSERPEIFRILSVSPNPFNPATVATVRLFRDAALSAAVYDVLGRRVRSFPEIAHTQGEHAIVWDGRDGAGAPVSSGVYIIVVDGGGLRASVRATLVR